MINRNFFSFIILHSSFIIYHLNVMDYSLKRQLSFGIVFIVIIAVIVFFAIRIATPTPTCLDGKQNQQEEKVDCGGPYCQACKVMKLEDINVISYREFPVGKSVYDALAEVRNKNNAHGVRLLEYVFTFYDADKNVIAEKKGSTHLLAGETRFIIENNIPVSTEKSVAFFNFSVKNPVAWEEQRILIGTAALPIFSKRYETAVPGKTAFASVVGTLQNKASYSFGIIDVNVVLTDSTGKHIAVGTTQVNNLRFKESRNFVVLFPQETPLPADIQAEATTNLFDASNVQ